jgi:hypothetical protein
MPSVSRSSGMNIVFSTNPRDNKCCKTKARFTDTPADLRVWFLNEVALEAKQIEAFALQPVSEAIQNL